MSEAFQIVERSHLLSLYFTHSSPMQLFTTPLKALFVLFSVIDSFNWFLKSSQEYLVNAGVPQDFSLGPTLFLLYINYLPDDVIHNVAIYADDTTVYSKCDQTSDLWQKLELASELESDLQDTVDWGRKWLVDFNAEKT